ncbi:hypothetical protein JFT70_14045 [Bacillus sp. TH11]|nr:hypothetical protein [Bacillus sp. TH11]
MDKTLYNKILAGMLSLFLVVGCVTYQPQQVDAFLGKVASFTAKKAAVWVAKESMENSIEKVLKRKSILLIHCLISTLVVLITIWFTLTVKRF